MKKVIKKLYYAIRNVTYSYMYRIGINNSAIIDGNFFSEGGNKINKGVRLKNVSIGYGSYIADDTALQSCLIGRYTSIGPRVMSVYGNHPIDQYVSTHPAFFSTQLQAGFTYVNKQKYKEFCDKKYEGYNIKIGNDVWIGSDVRILDGINIGNGAVIACGAVVTKDVEPFGIVGGVPAKLIRYRFDREDIEFLMKYEWWNRERSWIEKNADAFVDISILRNTT